MKLGVSTWLWQSRLSNDDLRRLAPHVAGMGFDLIEIPIDAVAQMDYGEAGRIVRDNGLSVTVCAAMGPGRDLIHPEEATRRDGMTYVKACIDASEAVGSDHVIGPLYSSVGRCWKMTADERERDTELLVGQLRELSDYARDRGVLLCVEPLNRFETSFMNLASQAVEVVDRVDRPACRILLDVFHLGIEEKDPGEAIRTAGHRLAHVHVSENDRGTPGTGHLPWPDIAAALHDVAFDGPIVIETFSEQNETIARAASIWRPLAESPDALARDGLEFLRELLTPAAA